MGGPRATGYLGKLPSRGDFVSHHASTPTMRAFDDWIRRGLEQIGREKSEDRTQPFESTSPVRFIFSDPDRRTGTVLVGVMKPSRDGKGRSFPFAVTREIPTDALDSRHLPYVPIRGSAFLEAAERVVEDAVSEQLNVEELSRRTESIEARIPVRPTPPRSYKRYLQQRTLGAFLQDLGLGPTESERYRLFGNLAEVFYPLRGQEAPRLRYGIEYPLGSGNDRSVWDTSFWIEASFRMLAHPPGLDLSCFWVQSAPKGVSPYLLLYLGQPRAGAFEKLYLGDSEADEVFSLAKAEDKTAGEIEALGHEFGALLEDEKRRVWEFLRSL